MIEKRFTMKGSTILENGDEITAWLSKINGDME